RVASAARRAFDANCQDIDRLLEIHADLGGSGRGRRHRLEVLNKSAIVLLTALWEAYCEDIAAEGLAHLVAHARDWNKIPKELQQRVAKELKNEQHELAVWRLAGDGWRTVLSDRLAALQQERNRQLNTPKTAQIDALFQSTLGTPTLSDRWYWPGMSKQQARAKLDRYVELRGGIAHRGAGARSVSKAAVVDYYDHIKRLVTKTGGGVNAVVRASTGRPLW
ncbi:MAG: HEPN domain-containing protein, partial [Chloroflexota bacterium]|nr:HEPN domain-containing protein [Chloroflexota bacterium]